MNKISKLMLVFFVSIVFNDISAMKSSLLVKLKNIADKKELKRVNKLFNDVNNKKILNPIRFFREGFFKESDILYSEWYFSIMNMKSKRPRPIFIKNAKQDYKDETGKGLCTRRKKNLLFSTFNKIIGESFNNLVACENEYCAINIFKIEKISGGNSKKLLDYHMKLLDYQLSSNNLVNYSKQSCFEFGAPIFKFTKQGLLYFETYDKKDISKSFIEIWDLEDQLDLKMLKLRLTLSIKEPLNNQYYNKDTPKYILNITNIVKSEKNDAWYIKLTFSELNLFKKVSSSHDDLLCPDYNKTLEELRNIDEKNIFPVYIIGASGEGFKIFSKKIRENKKNKNFINIDILNIEDVSKDSNVQKLEMIDKYGNTIE